MTRDDLLHALQIDNVQAFARVVRQGESRQDDLAYTMRYAGHGKPPAYFEDLSKHPRIYENTGRPPPNDLSSAAGAYQATYRTWNEEQQRWGFPDFSKQSQDEFFVARLIYRRALDAVIAGRFDEACGLCRAEWTSLPGGAERNAATAKARETFIGYGGVIAETKAAETPERMTPMAPAILFPLLELAAKFIPQLAEKFSSGSEVANRNMAAGKVVADAIVEATQSANLQAAVEQMQADPAAVSAAREAVADVWPSIFESGGGGIKGARDFAASGTAGGSWVSPPSPQFVLSIALLGLVYMAMANITGLFGFQDWTPENRSNVMFLIVGTAIGAITGFWFGTSHSSQKKDAVIAGVAR